MSDEHDQLMKVLVNILGQLEKISAVLERIDLGQDSELEKLEEIRHQVHIS